MDHLPGGVGPREAGLHGVVADARVLVGVEPLAADVVVGVEDHRHAGTAARTSRISAAPYADSSFSKTSRPRTASGSFAIAFTRTSPRPPLPPWSVMAADSSAAGRASRTPHRIITMIAPPIFRTAADSELRTTYWSGCNTTRDAPPRRERAEARHLAPQSLLDGLADGVIDLGEDGVRRPVEPNAAGVTERDGVEQRPHVVPIKLLDFASCSDSPSDRNRVRVTVRNRTSGPIVIHTSPKRGTAHPG